MPAHNYNSYMSDVSHHPADHTQYMDMFAPATAYPYDGYSGSSFFTPLSPATGVAGDDLFWGHQKHPVLGSGSVYGPNEGPFYNNQFRSDHTNEGIETGMSGMSLDGNGHSASNGLPSSGSEFSDFSAEQETPLTDYRTRVSDHSRGRKVNQSWASVASQPVRSSLRSKHSLSSRLIPAPNTDAIVAWDQSPSGSSKTLPATAGPQTSASSEKPAETNVPEPVSQKRNVVPAESSSWVLLNEEPAPPVRLVEIKTANQNVLHQNHNESEAQQQRRPVVAIRESKRDAFMGDERREHGDSQRPSDDSGNSINSHPEAKNKPIVSRSAAAPLKPVIDPSTLKDRQQLDHIFNPKEFDLNPADARFFVIKSYSEDDIHRSIKYSIWCSTERGNKRLDVAFRKTMSSGGVIYLFFSVNGSGHFCGMAQMLSPLDYNSSANVWAQDKWKGQFKVRWIYVKDVPNAQLRHIRLENNENKPVTNSRDTQEIPPEKGKLVLSIFHSFKHSTSIFDDFLHYEKRQEEETHRRIESHDSSSHPPVRQERADPRARPDIRDHRHEYSGGDERRHRVHDSRDHHYEHKHNEGRDFYDVRHQNTQRDAYHHSEQQQHRNRSSYQKPQHRDGEYRYDQNDQFTRSRLPNRRSD
jgi:hypothetical protein